MSWSNKTVAMTGAAGFIGSHLTETLVSRGATVYAIDNLGSGQESYLESVSGDITILEQDIRDDDFELPANADTLYHLAAVANPRACEDDFDKGFSVNVDGTKQVLQTATDSDCRRIVVASSAAVYGDPEYLPIDEDHDLNGDDPYSRTKQMTESLAWTYNDNYDLDVTATRNFNTFGPRHSKGYLIPTLLYQAINENKIEIWSETTSRDFIFIDDMVEALLTVAQSDAVIGEPVNIGTGNEWTSKELADRIAERFGGIDVINLEKDTTGSDRLVCDNTKLQTTTEWEPAVSFEDGLDRTVEWYRDQWEE